MRRCFLKFGDGRPLGYEVELTGFGIFKEGTECRAKGVDVFADPGYHRVRIGRLIDHIGTKGNRGGRVYEAVRLSEPARVETDLFSVAATGGK